MVPWLGDKCPTVVLQGPRVLEHTKATPQNLVQGPRHRGLVAQSLVAQRRRIKRKEVTMSLRLPCL